MMTIGQGTGIARTIAAFVIAAVVSAPSAGVAFEGARGEHAVQPRDGVLLASALRTLSAEPLRSRPSEDRDRDDCGSRSGASVAEKVAFLYLLVGGSVLLAYGPQERSGDRVSTDGKAEAVAGAAAIAISFALLRDILKKRTRKTSSNAAF
jgi:hypothetical protein